MITDAVVLGAIETAVYREDAELRAVRLDDDWNGLVDCSRDIPFMLSVGCEQRLLHEPLRDRDELLHHLSKWSARHRCLTMMERGMKARLRDATRIACIEAAEEGLAVEHVAKFARARLLGCPLNTDLDLEGATRLAFQAQAKGVIALYGDMTRTAAHIAPVRQALDDAIGESNDPGLARRAMVDAGVIAIAVDAVAKGDTRRLNDLLFHQAAVAEVPRAAHVLTRFIARLRALLPDVQRLEHTAQELASEPEPEADADVSPLMALVLAWKAEWSSDHARSVKPQNGFVASGKVKQRKEFIVKCLRQGRITQAQKAILELATYQRQTGRPEYLCKSLSDLGREAASLGRFDLSISLYEAAKVTNDEDHVPPCGLAEVLRKMGRLDEALSAYDEAWRRFSNDVVPFNGYAETLRELGRLDEALSAYADARQRFSNDVVAFNGYAETLRKLGRLDEALSAYADARQRFSNDVVAFNGYAETLRELGRLDEALSAYDDARRRFPNDVFAFNGYAETLLRMGRPADAHREYQAAVRRFPQNRVARNALACVMIELGRFAEARSAIAIAEPRTEQDWRDYHVVAMSYLKEGLVAQAAMKLRRGVEKNSFPHQRLVFENALALAELRLERHEEAVRLLPAAVDNVVIFPVRALLRAHASAALGEFTAAEREIAAVRAHPSAQILSLADFLERRFAIGRYRGKVASSAEARDLDGLIEPLEFDLVLRRVA